MTTFALHGMMGHYRDWESLGPDLQAVDLWRVGGVSKFESWSRAFNRSTGGAGSRVLVGYSMGGRLALHALLDQPGHWHGAVVVSAHPGLQDENERALRLQNDLRWAERARNLAWDDFLDLWNRQAVLKSASGSKWQLALEGRREKVAQAFEFWSLGNQADLRPALSRCATPVLWVTGGLDGKFTRLAEEVVAGNDCFEQVVIPGAGHRLLFENEASQKALKSLIGDFQKRIL
jgi:2-succinyl-6-hydroxy-2,4-cyclohexadiene-1-carboxylate synthase